MSDAVARDAAVGIGYAVLAAATTALVANAAGDPAVLATLAAVAGFGYLLGGVVRRRRSGGES
ncbi:hypothetical protein [Halobaculum sp. EA56]|uniref:hypothetical protein n=1 Tax=Halobaculum sp. EA56 TaxID=3421648 RepID=UPI003EBFAAA9